MALVDTFRVRKPAKTDGAAPRIDLERLSLDLTPVVAEALSGKDPRHAQRAALSQIIKQIIHDEATHRKLTLSLLQERNLITILLNGWVESFGPIAKAPLQPTQRASALPHHRPASAPTATSHASVDAASNTRAQSDDGAEHIADKRLSDILGDGETDDQRSASRERAPDSTVEAAAEIIRPALTEQIDISVAARMPRGELAGQITELLGDLLKEKQIQLNSMEQRNLVTLLVNDMLGLGPLEALLADEAVTDIMVNGPNQIYVERGGKLTLTDIHFRDNAHLMAVCTRIVSRIGRRVDESSPMCDARLADGSRVNIIIPPLALDGASVSIRKFAEKKITLEVMTGQANISKPMETVLKIASRSRLNVLISGGTGSGKTTLLNALSRMIDVGERVVTIEDAAELQLQQPHVVRLETRPANLEGKGEVTMRDLVKNALRMRPDRIILGEIRGGEAIDMLQAMNTGHDGSMCTIHANNPREALTRLENMVSMAGFNLPARSMRQQIASAIDVIVQVSRMRDGKRRITSVTEVVGMEGDIITTQELFAFKFAGEDPQGNLLGDFEPAGLRPHFTEKASYFGLDKPLLDAVADMSRI